VAPKALLLGALVWQRRHIMRLPGFNSLTHTWSFRWSVASTAVVLGLLSSCGKATFIVQQYDGSPLAEGQVAILRLNGDEPVRLEALDGEPLGYELHDRASRVHIEMLPGEHELALAEGPDLPAKRRRFRAEAGKVYRPLLVHSQTNAPVIPGVGGWVIGIYEVDPSSDDIVREISQVPVVNSSAAVAPVAPVSTPAQASTPIVPSAPSPAASATSLQLSEPAQSAAPAPAQGSVSTP